MYKYNKCKDITFNKNFFAKEMKNFIEKFFSPKVSSAIYISGEFEVGRKLKLLANMMEKFPVIILLNGKLLMKIMNGQRLLQMKYLLSLMNY